MSIESDHTAATPATPATPAITDTGEPAAAPAPQTTTTPTAEAPRAARGRGPWWRLLLGAGLGALLAMLLAVLSANAWPWYPNVHLTGWVSCGRPGHRPDGGHGVLAAARPAAGSRTWWPLPRQRLGSCRGHCPGAGPGQLRGPQRSVCVPAGLPGLAPGAGRGPRPPQFIAGGRL